MDRFDLDHCTNKRYHWLNIDNPYNYWIVNDYENNVCCVFEYKKFDDTKKFYFMTYESFEHSSKLELITKDMKEWLRNNYFDRAYDDRK